MTPTRTLKSIRLVALDMDDTLLTPEVTISERSRSAIHQLQERGVIVTLATGRMYRSAAVFARELGLDAPLITYQGALVKTAQSLEVFHYHPVPQKIARELVTFFRQKDLHTNLYIDDFLHMNRMGQEGQYYSTLARMPVRVVPNLLECLSRDSIKVLAVGEPKRIEAVKAEALERWGEELFITTSKPCFLEIMNRLANKGTALEAVARHYGIDREEVMAIGDADNDLPMLEFAGWPVAMGNAPERVKARARHITAKNSEDGVAKAIEELALSR